MDLLATGTTVKPGLPARTGDVASDGEKADETAIFEAFLGLTLSVFSPDAHTATGPEGKTMPDETGIDSEDPTGRPAMPSGNILPVPVSAGSEAIQDLPVPAAKVVVTLGLPSIDQVAELQPVGTKPIVKPGAAHLVPTAIALPVAEGEAPVKAPNVTPGQQATLQAQISQVAEELQPRSPALPTAETTQVAGPAAQKPKTAEPAAAARNAVPVARVLAGRQGIKDGTGEPAARPESQVAPVMLQADQPVASKPAEPSSNTRSGGTRDHSQTAALSDAPEASVKTGMQEGSATPSPEPLTAPQTSGASKQLDASAPASVLQASTPAQSVTGAGAPSAATDSTAHDFMQIVERLARARETEQGEVVRSSLATREFGQIAMQLRPTEGRLHVSLTAADPSFAPAVQAASSVAGTGQQANPDSSTQSQAQHQPHGHSAQSYGQNQTGPESQARRQDWERAAQGESPDSTPASSGSATGKSGTDPRGADGSAIYA